jgi:hypothetical protein
MLRPIEMIAASPCYPTNKRQIEQWLVLAEHHAADASDCNAVADARIRDFPSAFIKVTKAYGTIELMAVRHRISLNLHDS